MAFFGMTVAELLKLQKQILIYERKSGITEIREEDAKKRAKFMLDEAKLEAQKTTFEAQRELASLTESKRHVENQLRELIEVEKELIKRYDVEEDN